MDYLSAMNVDVLALGTSITTLKLMQLMNEYRDVKIIAVDCSPRPGGIIAPISTIIGRVSLVPLLGVDSAKSLKFNVETVIVKDGDYVSKVHAFENHTHFQEPWFIRWRKAFASSKSMYITVDTEPIVPRLSRSRIVSNIRKIFIERRIAALSTGATYRFRYLVTAWPLDVLLRKVTPLPNSCSNIVNQLRSIAVHISLFVEELTKESSGHAIMYIHSTKASRFHTAIKLFLGRYAITYAYTSFTHSYPLLPGITEKIISEMKRFRIVNEERIVDERHAAYMYAALSKTDCIRECLEELEGYDILCVGRLGTWREASINDLYVQANEALKKLSF